LPEGCGGLFVRERVTFTVWSRDDNRSGAARKFITARDKLAAKRFNP
jgi:hypothetical protein